MAEITVDPSQVHTIEVDPSQVSTAKPSPGIGDQLLGIPKGFFNNLAQSGEGLLHMIAHPIDTLSKIGPQQDALRQKAVAAFKAGRPIEGTAHALYYLMPLIGPQLDASGEKAMQGKWGEAAGESLATGLQLAAPELVKGTSIPIAPRITNPNSTEAAALDYLEQKGVPVPAGARTGNPFVKNIQKAADSTPLGAVVAQRAQAQTTGALANEADALASRVNPAPVVPEQAGAGVQGALRARTSAFAAQADQAYQQFRQIEQNTPMPVDVSQIKAQLLPIYQDMQKWMEPAKRNASAGFQALKSIVEGPDTIPASQAEIGLGGLKQLAREGTGRNSGLAKFVTPKLQATIDQKVGAADPSALRELQAGRTATAAQYGTQAILDDLRTEPVQAFGQMVYAKDAGIDLLRRVAKEAPGELPKVGRAYLEDLFSKAQSQGGWTGADGLFSKWQQLGPQTKKLLFNSPQMVSDLDNFFLGAKKLAENPNPSGTAIVGMSAGSGTLVVTNPAVGIPMVIGAGALSKLLHSPAGVRMLTQGMRIPLKAPGAALAAGQILKLAGSDVQPLPAAAQNSPAEQTELAKALPGQQ